MLQGTPELVLAFDPTSGIQRVLAFQAAIDTQFETPALLSESDRGTLADILRTANPDLAEEPIDAEVVEGEKLKPFRRFAPGYGIDPTAYVEIPGPVPIFEWLQGSAALPHAAEGDALTPESWQAFQSLARGQSGLLVILLN